MIDDIFAMSNFVNLPSGRLLLYFQFPISYFMFSTHFSWEMQFLFEGKLVFFLVSNAKYNKEKRNSNFVCCNFVITLLN